MDVAAIFDHRLWFGKVFYFEQNLLFFLFAASKFQDFLSACLCGRCWRPFPLTSAVEIFFFFLVETEFQLWKKKLETFVSFVCSNFNLMATQIRRIHLSGFQMISRCGRVCQFSGTGLSIWQKVFSPTENNPLNMFKLIIICSLFRLDACSSRSTPKPRPPLPEIRPNITFQTYQCPEAYARWYCLNGATCFSVRIGESILYNCECADGYMGQRCEFKDLEGSYLRKHHSVCKSIDSNHFAIIV